MEKNQNECKNWPILRASKNFKSAGGNTDLSLYIKCIWCAK